MDTTHKTTYCPLCGGDGWFDGAGELARPARSETTCPACDGTGRVDKDDTIKKEKRT